MCGGVIYYGFTAFFNPIMDEFGWSATELSFAFSLRGLESGLLAPVIGFLTDRLGVRKVTVFGWAVAGLGFILTSRAHSLWAFYGAFALLSLGGSCGISTPYVAVANWFARKRTWVMALMSTGFAFSGAMGPVLVWLINQYGWRDALFILGIAIWVVGAPLGLVLRHRPEPYGYLPDGGRTTPTQTGSPEASTPTVTPPPLTGLTTRQALATRAFWMLFIFGVLSGFVQSALNVHEMPYLVSIGISRQLAGWVILGITGFSLIGRLGFGWAGDIYDKRYLLAIGAVLQLLGTFIFAYLSHPWMLLPFLLLYGPGYASQIPLYPAIRADLFGLKNYATIGGLVAMSWTICGIVAPLLAGWVFDVTGSYRPIWLAYAIASAVAIPFVLMIKRQEGISKSQADALPAN
ncbi:MAG: MFS transporter [Chloroflexota bacterium]